MLIYHRYIETILILYSKNVFITSSPDVIEFLPRLLMAPRINTIRYLCFQWRVAGAPPVLQRGGYASKGDRRRNKIWVRMWENLAAMEGLEELRVKLWFSDQSWENLPTADINRLIEPILAVRAPRIFELSLPMHQQPESSPWAALPFQVCWQVPASG